MAARIVIETRLDRLFELQTLIAADAARMHGRNDDRPYHSSTDAMRYWPETATAFGVRRTHAGTIEVAAPWGLDDLFNLVVRPTARFTGVKHAIYLDRVKTKNWQSRWPGLTIAC